MAVWVVCEPTLVVLSSSIFPVICQYPATSCHCPLCLGPPHHLSLSPLLPASSHPTTFTVICQWPPNHFHCLFASDHPTTSTVFCQCCGTHQDKTNQTQSNQKKQQKKTKSDITHKETHSHNSCVLGCWAEQQICWRSDFFHAAFGVFL